MDPADFYTGIVAESYAPLKSFSPDPELYAGFVGEAGNACPGTGLRRR